MRPVLQVLAVAATVVLVGMTALLAALTLKRASLPYENGRHFDVVYSVVHDESAITVYGLLALACASVAGVLIFLTVRLRKNRQ